MEQFVIIVRQGTNIEMQKDEKLQITEIDIAMPACQNYILIIPNTQTHSECFI